MIENQIVGAVEMGAGKIVAAIGEISNGHTLSIIGVGEATSRGIKKGEVHDFQSASSAVHSAIMAAEQIAGLNLESIYLSQTGSHLHGFYNEGSVNVASSDNFVTQSDIDRVTLEAKSKEVSSNRVYIHHIQNAFRLDGRQVGQPLGMEGRKLEVGYWSVHGDLRKIRDQIHIINAFGLKVDDIIISSIASGVMVADEAEKKNGVLVIDIGRGTTDFAIYREGYVILTGVVPVGGDHFTNDISLGLRVNHNEAESLKVQSGRAIINLEDDEKIYVENPGGHSPRAVHKTAIEQIINARAQEIFEIIKGVVEDRVNLSELAAGVVVTGGGSRMQDLDKVAKEIFKTEVRLGDNPAWACSNLRDPEYSTVLGLMHYALKSKEAFFRPKSKKIRLFSRFSKFLNLN